MEIILGTLCFLILVIAIKLFFFSANSTSTSTTSFPQIETLQSGLKEDFRINREENATLAKDNRQELSTSLKDFRGEMSETLVSIRAQNTNAINEIKNNIDAQLSLLSSKFDENTRLIRDTLTASIKEFILEQKAKTDELKSEQKDQSFRISEQLEKITSKVESKLEVVSDQNRKDSLLMRDTFDKNVASFNNLQKEKFAQLEEKQSKLIESTEKRLDEMRGIVDEKLQKTLNDRINQSFEIVTKQLENVQKGLGEMQTLAQDVGSLKRVLTNVKMRGGFGEAQLSLLLEHILAPEQYEANVRTKAGSSESVEFAVKLPGNDESQTKMWLPIDAKFPKDAYEQVQNAYDTGEVDHIEIAQKNLENTIRKMARAISEKYIDPPNTTDFAILFLPFEGIYAEVVRKASLLEDLQRLYKVVVTGPTTLAAILNSLQMGFRTLAIQKRSSEVWKVLGAVKKEFENFGGMLEKAQKNLHNASDQLDEVMGKRTRAIQRKLKTVEVLSETEAKQAFPEISSPEKIEDEDDEPENV